MKANDRKYFLGYLNKLLGKCNDNNTSIAKKPINTAYSAFIEETESNPKAPKFKVGDRVKIAKHKNIFSKCYTKN